MGREQLDARRYGTHPVGGPYPTDDQDFAMDIDPAPARRPVWPWILAIVAGTALGAAGGWTAAVSTRPEATAAAVSAPPSASVDPEEVPGVAPSSTPTVAAAPAGTLKLGQAYAFTADGDKVSVTALAHKRQGDFEGVQVRTCNTGTATFPASTLPWQLSYAGGEELVDITAEGGGLLSPPFVERDLSPGKCVKGWISFEAAPTGKPDGVEYRIEDVTPARWEW